MLISISERFISFHYGSFIGIKDRRKFPDCLKLKRYKRQRPILIVLPSENTSLSIHHSHSLTINFGCLLGILKRTFHYDSPFWTNKKEYGIPEGETGFDDNESKLPTYWNTPFTKICLIMKIKGQPTTRFLVLNEKARSLYALIGDDKYRKTKVSRGAWKKLIGPEASLQLFCYREGFNVVGDNKSFSKARIGYVADQENDCLSFDSRIGFGTGGHQDDSNTCGNEATNSADNGDKHIKAMGYILVQ